MQLNYVIFWLIIALTSAQVRGQVHANRSITFDYETSTFHAFSASRHYAIDGAVFAQRGEIRLKIEPNLKQLASVAYNSIIYKSAEYQIHLASAETCKLNIYSSDELSGCKSIRGRLTTAGAFFPSSSNSRTLQSIIYTTGNNNVTILSYTSGAGYKNLTEISAQQLPADIAIYDANDTHVMALLFYKQLYGKYVVSNEQLLNDPIEALKPSKNVDWKNGAIWWNSVAELCLDSTLHAASAGANGFTFYAGKFQYTADSGRKKALTVSEIAAHHYPLAVFGNGAYFVQPDGAYYGRLLMDSGKLDFKMATAAFATADQKGVFLFTASNEWLKLKITKSNSKLTQTAAAKITTRWRGAFKQIDAALHFNGIVYFFAGSFYQTVPLGGGTATPPKMTQSLFHCDDAIYSDYLGELLDITNFEQFEKYKQQFAESDANSRTTNAALSKAMIFTIIVAAAAIAIAVCFVAYRIVNRKSPARRHSSENLANLASVKTLNSNKSVSTAIPFDGGHSTQSRRK